jgi:hypothetical protein
MEEIQKKKASNQELDCLSAKSGIPVNGRCRSTKPFGVGLPNSKLAAESKIARDA